MMAMVVMAVLGYAVAYMHAERGKAHYQTYTAAYQVCFAEVLEGAVSLDCNHTPAVRVHLANHRQAYAIGEPFLNLAVALTLAVMLAPLIRSSVRWAMNSLSNSNGNGNGNGNGAVDPKHPPANDADRSVTERHYPVANAVVDAA